MARVRVLAVLVLFFLLAPGPGRQVDAQDLVAGSTAVVVSDGDGLWLREGPGYDAATIELFPDGTSVSIIDGPIYAEDGSIWFSVAAGDRYGYMVSDWLVAQELGDEVAAPAPPQATAASGCEGLREWGQYVLDQFAEVTPTVEEAETIRVNGSWFVPPYAFALVGTMTAMKGEFYSVAAPAAAAGAKEAMLRQWDGYIWEVETAGASSHPQAIELHWLARAMAEYWELESTRRLIEVTYLCGLMPEGEYNDMTATILSDPGYVYSNELDALFPPRW
jgi:hypothetical protein